MRNYIVASWSDADQYNYSGEQIGNRQSKSQRVHFNADGSACVASYGDPEPVKVKKPDLKDRIIPQYKRVQTLTEQLIELENAYRAGEYDIDEYSLLRGVVCKKRDRAVELYKRAIKPVQTTDDEEYLPPHPQHTPNTSEHTDFTKEKTANSAKKDLQVFAFGSIILFVGFQLVRHFI